MRSVQVQKVRKKLMYSSFPLANGLWLRFVYVHDKEGFILRTAGPNRVKLREMEEVSGLFFFNFLSLDNLSCP